MVDYLRSNCWDAWNDMVWIDIEGADYWTGDYDANRSWYESLIAACDGLWGARCGVYSSYYQWEAIFGSTDYSWGSSSVTPQLWYAHYDDV